ncbi:acyltransferase [Rhodococcus pyridinivorans]|uniref:acyltransferase family protein n=1 Tax=Rhodococcus pyridinivorans TaxID=103816 RepID=UPI002164980E|nr:acyltransferase [Rhodococcus pyridinivorans]UVT24993.1 acyltransferase [Rhodococcus pyridinivorans]
MAKRIPELDGIRGIAVGLVVAGHWWATQADSSPDLTRAAQVIFKGSTGVLIFLVLSGYLITGIIAREREKHGTISLYNFYVRRTLRIMPAFYFFLAAMAVVAALGYISIAGTEFLSAGLYLWNYFPGSDGWWLGHTWSLAVEEQFYLIWPALFLLLKPRAAAWLAIGYIALAPVIRVASYFLLPSSRESITIMFHTRADSLLVGCLFALLPYVFPAVWARIRDFIVAHRVEWPALAVLVISNGLQVVLGGAWMLTFGYSLSNLAVVIIIVAVLERQKSAMGRALRWKPLVGLGLISYSLYLWQQPFLYHGDDAPFFADKWWSVLAAIAAAYFSYKVIEGPFLRLKPILQRERRESKHRLQEQNVRY